jgi:hypothetical protein
LRSFDYVIWGLRRGLLFAGLLILFLLGQALLRYREIFSDGSIAPGRAVLLAVGACLAGGVVGGAILGLLRPLLRSRGGATLVGILIGAMLGLSIRLTIDGVGPWTTGDVIQLAVFSVSLGGSCGFILSTALRRRSGAHREGRIEGGKIP